MNSEFQKNGNFIIDQHVITRILKLNDLAAYLDRIGS